MIDRLKGESNRNSLLIRLLPQLLLRVMMAELVEAIQNKKNFKHPSQMKTTGHLHDPKKYCAFYRDHDHEDCRHFRNLVE